MKTFTNTDLSLSITAADVDGFNAGLKSHGLKTGGKKPVAELFEGKRDEVQGFYFVEELSTAVVDEVIVVDELVAEPVVDLEPVGITEDAVAAAVEAALAGGMEVITQKAATPVDVKPAPVRVKAVMKASAPKGKIKPVRKDTKIAKGLELLAGGTTEAELAGAGIGDDPVDFVNRRVTKRGYGIALVDGKVSLVFPAGVTAITYSGS
jgi:hypothetical protein